jgi:hypothetical protein
MARAAPVMKADSSLSRKAAKAAISAGLATRPMGFGLAIRIVDRWQRAGDGDVPGVVERAVQPAELGHGRVH